MKSEKVELLPQKKKVELQLSGMGITLVIRSTTSALNVDGITMWPLAIFVTGSSSLSLQDPNGMSDRSMK
jgi:hypothetical protein